MKMMVVEKIASVNVHNSLMMNQDIEIFGPMFDLLGFENNEIREMMIDRFEKIADLMKTEEIEIEHLEIGPLENESMQ
jgi:hypothetical protein